MQSCQAPANSVELRCIRHLPAGTNTSLDLPLLSAVGLSFYAFIYNLFHLRPVPTKALYCHTSHLVLLSAFGLCALLLALLVDASRERVLEAKRNKVDNKHLDRQEHTGRLPVPERCSEEAQGGAVVHRGIGNVEWEASDTGVHQDTKVVAEIRAGEAESPHAGDNENIPGEEEPNGDVLDEVRLEVWVSRLASEGLLVQVVAEYAKGENGCSEEVAA